MFVSIFILFSLSGCTGGKQPVTKPANTGSQPTAPTPTLAATAAAPILPTETPGPIPTATSAANPISQSAPTETTTAPAPTATPLPPITQPAPIATLISSPVPPTSTSAPTDLASACTDIAAYYGDVTIPDDTPVKQGETFVKIWRVRNAGTCAWDKSYALVHQSGEVMSAPLSNPLPDVPPGATVDISIELTAPARGGRTVSYWEFQNPQGKRFGVGAGNPGPLWAQVLVTFLTPSPTETPAEGGSGGTASTCSPTRHPEYESAILDAINQARANAGRGALTLSLELSAAALEHSTDMACNHYVDHTGSDGSTWFSRVAAQGYANYNSARENIYVGHPEFGGTPDGAMTWWMNSQVHRDNILFEAVTQIGIGMVTWPGSDWGGYYTVVFARP
jgi:uncharacterized protein YkwD